LTIKVFLIAERILKLVRVERIELSTKRWQRLILPLNYTRITWYLWRESNSRLSVRSTVF
jgi:hypothetical protein